MHFEQHPCIIASWIPHDSFLATGGERAGHRLCTTYNIRAITAESGVVQPLCLHPRPHPSEGWGGGSEGGGDVRWGKTRWQRLWYAAFGSDGSPSGKRYDENAIAAAGKAIGAVIISGTGGNAISTVISGTDGRAIDAINTTDRSDAVIM